MRRIMLLLALATVVSAVGAAGANAAGDQPTRGFFRGQSVSYLDFGPIRLAAGNRVAPIWVVTNGTRAQRNIIDTVPGMENYTPLWRVTMVTWRKGVKVRTLKSAAAVRAAVRVGKVKLKKTSLVVNCPVLGFGEMPTPGFAKGQSIEYLDLGAVKLAAGNDVAPIWVVANGSAEQHNIIDVLPGDPGYTPLWSVVMVTWKDGVAPRTLKSKAEVEAAMAAGEVTLADTDIVVNCPVI